MSSFPYNSYEDDSDDYYALALTYRTQLFYDYCKCEM